MRGLSAVFAALSLLTAACGGGNRAPEAPVAETTRASATEPPHASALDDVEQGSFEPSAPAEAEAATPEPQFTDDMSVDQAVKAVPSDAERRNLDPDTLAEPLRNAAVYEECKPGTARVKLRVAVWDGRAVGVDVNTAPKNDRLAACIREKVRAITWAKHVKSLNTVEYQF